MDGVEPLVYMLGAGRAPGLWSAASLVYLAGVAPVSFPGFTSAVSNASDNHC
jgi:hypothetical protein